MPVERILVTGASGFVGRQTLAPLVARGWEVNAVCTRPDRAPVVPGVTWHCADLLANEGPAMVLAAVRPHCLLHCAWYVAHGKFWTAPENAAWAVASATLLSEFVARGGRRFVGVGSCAEYAPAASGDGQPWPERRPAAPVTPYGRAKADLAARVTAVSAPGVTTAWARLFHLFGPGEPPARLVPNVLSALLAGKPALCGSGRQVRDFCSTWFIGVALAALASCNVTGAVNIASGQPVSIADLVWRIGELCGRPNLVRLGALPDRPEEVPYMAADITRLRQEVGLTIPCEVMGDLDRLRRSWSAQ